MIAVLDTNVYVSALVFGGNPRRIVRLAEDRHLSIAISLPLLAELAEILSVKFGWSKSQIDDVLRTLGSSTTLHYPNAVVSDCPDPDDNRVLECAQAAGAKWIVTGDRHLLAMDPWRSARVLTPASFLSEWQKAPTPGE
jgi:putative PIN family toxin of toxin-antitoxin system